MTTSIKPLEELIQELPPDLRGEVRDFVEFLLTKNPRPGPQQLRQDWAGALRDTNRKDTSVELQHQALSWRTE